MRRRSRCPCSRRARRLPLRRPERGGQRRTLDEAAPIHCCAHDALLFEPCLRGDSRRRAASPSSSQKEDIVVGPDETNDASIRAMLFIFERLVGWPSLTFIASRTPSSLRKHASAYVTCFRSEDGVQRLAIKRHAARRKLRRGTGAKRRVRSFVLNAQVAFRRTVSDGRAKPQMAKPTIYSCALWLYLQHMGDNH